MKLSLSNGIFSKLSVKANLETVKRLGFDNIEFNMKSIKKEQDTGVYREQKALADSGLNCLSLHSAVLHVADPIEVHQAVYYGKISIECARALKAPLMVVHSNVAKTLQRKQRERCLREVFGEIVPFAKKMGVKLALENLSVGSSGFGINGEQLAEVLGIIDVKSEMGVTFDLCHALETGVMDELLETYGNRICNVHMANKDHQPFMKKAPELSRFLAKLHTFGYEGPITLELEHRASMETIVGAKTFLEGEIKNL